MSYLSQPALSKTHLYFISEEDLWSVPLANPDVQATRLTAGLGPIANPKVSPDGNWIAVASEEEGHCEVYVLPANGGELKRVSYFGAWSYPIGWKDANTILFKSNAKHAHRMQEFFQVSREGGIPEALRMGEGTSLDFSKDGVVIERNMHRPDPAHWKRYRGGTMGQLWVGKNEDSAFKRLSELPGNLSGPLWIDGRIFYLSDETGLGRIYSCDANGSGKRIHGGDFYSEYYFRNLTTNRESLAFQSAGDLFLYDPKDDQIRKVGASVTSDLSKSKRKSVAGVTSFTDYSLQPQGEKIAIESRGKILTFGHWNGPVSTLGIDKEVRYKNPDWLADGKRVVVCRDDGLNEKIEIYSDHGLLIKSIAAPANLKSGFGRILAVKAAPRGDELVFSNHRNELIHLDLSAEKAILIHQNLYQVMEEFNWSPDARYIAFSYANSRSSAHIAIWEKEKTKVHLITEGTFEDYSPCFDPEGKYLYFLSKRIFNPIYDDVIFDMTFPKAGLPLLVILKNDAPSPFLKESALPDNLAKAPFVATKFEDVKCEIDFAGIQDRIVQFPVQEAKYTKIVGLGRKVLWTYLPVEGTLTPEVPGAAVGKQFIDCFDFTTGKFEYFGTGVTNFKVRHECNLRIVRSGNVLRLVKATDKAEDLVNKPDAIPKSGIIDLTRANVMVDPKSEWVQMFKDAWRMQKDYYWREDLNGVDWDAAYKRYEPIVKKVNCRREFSDVIWEMIGELGTSHAYERGGDYRGVPVYALGSLGAEFAWKMPKNAYEITKIYRGDQWAGEGASPLLTPGISLSVGDLLLEVGGQKLSATLTPMEATLNLAGRDLWIRYQRKDSSEAKDGMIRTLKNDQPLIYRNWVEEKRALVKKHSQGRLGYIHIPNMMGQGFAEFHRNFMQEVECEGLVVDIRYNGGGHVSQLILDRLARKPIGRSDSRWFGSRSVPFETPRKVVVAVCNEFAGSDGDIFSHTFKMRKIGKLIGTRTWGGVVGIWPRNFTVDGGLTTQPEFSTWFEDVGYDLENHGTDPDLVVDFAPEAWRKNEDPQLTAAIAEAMKSL
jgi:tricorn protease